MDHFELEIKKKEKKSTDDEARHTLLAIKMNVDVVVAAFLPKNNLSSIINFHQLHK